MPLSPEEEEAIRREFEASRNAGHEQKKLDPANDPGPQMFEQAPGSHVRHVIGVVSGKGGVGKSLVCGMIATELARTGAKVGILDADLTGPSIPKMFGLSGMHATAYENLLVPVETVVRNIKIMSANLVLESETDPVLWRGPVVAGALLQFWGQCDWGELDYLLIDMPPGTGDIPMTVFQQFPLKGVVVATAPQVLVNMIVEEAIRMADHMNVPVVALVENMSYYECPDCGTRHEIFGKSEVEAIAKDKGIDTWTRVPMDPKISAEVDAGKAEDIEGDWYKGVADKLETL